MKIGLVIYGSLDTLSGGYLYDRQLVRQLRACGAEVHIVSLPWRNYAAHLADNLNLRFRCQIAHRGFDLILQDELNHPSLFLINRTLRQATTAPIVSIVHHLRSHESHPPLRRRLYAAIERRYLATVDAFLVNSWTTRRAVEDIVAPIPHEAGVPFLVAHPAADHLTAPSAEQVTNRIDSEYCAATNPPAAPLNIAFAGNVSERKALHTVIEALAIARGATSAEDFRLQVIGSLAVDPAYVARIHRLIAHHRLESTVHLYGRVDDAKLSATLSQCQIFALPSFEGFGIVYLEAMRHGLCPIASTAGAAQELIHHGENGYLVAPESPAHLAARLLQLRSQPQRLQRIRQSALDTALHHPPWTDTFSTAHQWLHEILSTVKPD